MNDDGTSLWSHHHQASPTSGGSGDNATEDFSSLFDFNNIQLSMSSPFDTTGAQDDHPAMDTDFTNADELRANGHSNDVGGPLDTAGLLGSEDMLDMRFHDLHSLQTSHQHQHHHHHHQQHQHQQEHHSQMLARQHMMQGGMIPPTPSSIDLQTGLPHGPCSHMGSQSDIMMERYNSLRDEQMIFTPLVSPAVTPLDTNFVHQVPEFTIPGYFSPLTSPALDAHPHRTHMPNPHMMHTHSQSASPIDPVDSPNINKRGSTGRRKSTTSRNPARVVRESPSMKAQRKKLPAALAATPELANALSKQPPTPTAVRQSASQCRGREQMGFQPSTDASSNESVSPEPLPEVLMAPPPPRNGNSQSPQNCRSDDGSSTSTTPGAPATPASLMKLTKTNLPTEDIPPIAMETSDFLNGDVERVMADAPLVSRNDDEAGGGGATATMASPHLDADNQSTPTIGASKTPSLKPVPSSGSSVSSGSRHESPINIQTPGSVLNKQKVNKSGTSGRGGKRGSVSSSPGLQPKISPSIKPLLPSGMTSESSALLLKSNYQNIVEGTHKQLGLSYPADLSTNLTSKRTSHKIAEQGRRNRINNALTEIASLLPQKATPSSSGGGSNSDGGGGGEGRSSISGGGGGGGGGGSAGAGQASKASTVEMAIDYIKQLKKELEDTKGKLADAERKLGEKAGGES